MGVVGPGEMVKDLVLSCVQSWLNRFGREDIVKMVSENFIDKEIFDGLKCLCDCLGLDPPKIRRNTMKQVAVKVWSAEMYDTLMKEDNAGKLPEFVVSSQELQRVPLALLSGANDVVPICTKMNMLEKKMEEMVDNMVNFTKVQVLHSAPQPNDGSYASVAQGGLNGVQLLGTPVGRGRVGSFAGAAALALKRKHSEEAIAAARAGQGQGEHHGQGALGPLGAHNTPGGHQGGAGSGNNQVKPPPKARKQCYGTSKIVATAGRADWAAPVEVFISNTSPDITDNDVKEILKLCAEDAKNTEGNENLDDFAVKEAKCLTKADLENPRTKCWKVSVPFRYKDYIFSDMAYPMGWSHRPFYPPKMKSKEELEAEQQAKRARRNNM